MERAANCPVFATKFGMMILTNRASRESLACKLWPTENLEGVACSYQLRKQWCSNVIQITGCHPDRATDWWSENLCKYSVYVHHVNAHIYMQIAVSTTQIFSYK